MCLLRDIPAIDALLGWPELAAAAAALSHRRAVAEPAVAAHDMGRIEQKSAFPIAAVSFPATVGWSAIASRPLSPMVAIGDPHRRTDWIGRVAALPVVVSFSDSPLMRSLIPRPAGLFTRNYGLFLGTGYQVNERFQLSVQLGGRLTEQSGPLSLNRLQYRDSGTHTEVVRNAAVVSVTARWRNLL